MNPTARRCAPRRDAGLSLVDLMVGVTIGLVVLGGTLKLMASQIGAHRRVLLEARLHQDLRAATDLISRDLRRAGHWQRAWRGTVWPTQANPYRELASASADTVTYSFSRDDTENDTLDSNERFGFRLGGGALQALQGAAGWQPVTDPGTVLITRLVIEPTVRTVPLGHLCATPCAADDPACPALRIRHFELRLEGRAAADAAVVREVRDSVRVRNDEPTKVQCP